MASAPAPPLIGYQIGAVSPDDAEPGLALPAETIEEQSFLDTLRKIGRGVGTAASNGNATGGRQVWPSRTFGSEDEFPPESFAGYGIVAFNSRPEAARGRMFCEAFTRALLTVQQQLDRGAQIERQMVTVWPMESSSAAAAAREAETTTETCDIAVRRYGLGLAEDSIWEARQAELAGTIGRIRGRGPFLLAWAPGESKGSPDVLVLVANLSDVATPEQAVLDFERWKDDIQRNSELWERGWSVENVRIVIQRWADGRSGALLSLIGLRP